MMDKLDIRYTELKDFEYLLTWLNDPDNNKWFPFSTSQEIEESAKNWINFSRYKSSLTGVVDNKVCAIGTLFLMPYRKLIHHCMFYMIVDKKYRNHGIGSTMLKNLINLGQNYFKLESIFTEVFENSPMIPLLEKFKFNQFAKQENFIKIDDNHYLARILFDIWFK
ncbi:MAG: GNAT family protein [Parachlamydiales bacterium]|jgi:RimJ/RimL family protein N-acetyltransferase